VWTYEQSTGLMSYPDGMMLAKGYAGGNEGRMPEGVNNPAMQDVSCVGPLPRGKYTMSCMIKHHPRLGPYAIELVGDAENESFGRSGFFIHGDRSDKVESASEGCIIMPRVAREIMWKSKDHRVEVIA
jgi:Tlde1 domain